MLLPGLGSEPGLRAEVDDRTESLNKKIRDAQLKHVPLILTIGQKEKESGNYSVRTLDGNVKYGVKESAFFDIVLKHIGEKRLELDIFKD